MTKKIKTSVLAILLSIFAAVSFCFVGNALTANGQSVTASAQVQVDQKVTELVDMVLAFPEAYDNGQLTQAIADFEAAYNDVNVTDNQRNAVDATAVTGSTYYDNISDMYHYYDAADTQSAQAASVVIDLIDNLGTVTIARDFYLKLIAAENAYATLSEQTKKYVTNYADLVAARNAFNEKMGVVKDWKTAVENIVLPITVSNWDLIDAADTEWGKLSQDVKDVVTLETATYGDLLDKVAQAVVEKQAILDTIDNVNGLIADIPNDIPAIGNGAERDAYKDAVADAKAAYEALANAPAGTQEYFDANYPAEKYKLLVAIDRLVVIDVEDIIEAIPSVITLTQDCKDAIDEARAAYDAMTARQDEVRNYGKLVDAETQYASKIQMVTDWKDDVAATRGGLEDADLWSVDLNEYKDNVADTLAYRYAQFTQDEKDYAVTVAGKADFDAIKAVSDARIANLNDRIDNLPATLTQSDVAEVYAIYNDYLKLHETQKEFVNYDAFLPYYTKVTFANFFDRAVYEIEAQANAGKYTLSDKIMLNALEAILISATPELQAIVETADLLDELVVEYEGVEVMDLHDAIDAMEAVIAQLTDAVIPELYNTISQIQKQLSDQVTELNEQIVALQNEVKTLQSKTTTTNVVFGILFALCAGAIVYMMFFKKN